MEKLKKLRVALTILAGILVAPTIVYAIALSNLNGVEGATQAFVNDSNISLVPNDTTNTHTLIWSGHLPISRGGTGNSSFITGSILFASGASISQDNTNLFWNDTSNMLSTPNITATSSLNIFGGNGTGFANGGSLTLRAGNGASFPGAGGAVNINGGVGIDGQGGAINIFAGDSLVGSAPGNVTIKAGNSVSGAGASVLIQSGMDPDGNSGNIALEVPDSAEAQFGDIRLLAGDSILSGVGGDVFLTAGDGGPDSGGGPTPDGGDVTITGGAATLTTAGGGVISLVGGPGGATGPGGNIELKAGGGNTLGTYKLLKPGTSINQILNVTNISADRTATFPNYSGEIVQWVTAPASASSTCTTGMAAYESGFLYICVATDTWQRVVIATW